MRSRSSRSRSGSAFATRATSRSTSADIPGCHRRNTAVLACSKAEEPHREETTDHDSSAADCCGAVTRGTRSSRHRDPRHGPADHGFDGALASRRGPTTSNESTFVLCSLMAAVNAEVSGFWYLGGMSFTSIGDPSGV